MATLLKLGASNKTCFMSIWLIGLALLFPLSPNANAQELDTPLSERIPRTPGGHPDFSGMWIKRSGGSNSFDPYVKRFEDQKPPLTPEYMKIWRRRMDARARGEPMEDPTAACLPGGIVRLLNLVLPSEILQTDKMLYWTFEWNNDYFRAYLDGRDLPDDLYPTYNGFSRGDWDGDVFVMETVALRGDTLVESSGIPHSDKMTMEMRMKYIDENTLENVLTITDPVAFTEPWTSTRHYIRPPEDYRMLEYICQENNRNPIGPDGKTQVILQGYDEDKE